MIHIRKVTHDDHDDVWQIIKEVISTGDTYVFDPDTPKEKMLDYWCGEDKHTYVAILNDNVAGTFIIKDNQPGLGAHVANAGYMASSSFSGQGVGTAMGEFSIREAKRLGYRAIQFNIVVASNHRAIRLWEKLGFAKIGEIPEAFNHRRDGFTNALIMYRQI